MSSLPENIEWVFAVALAFWFQQAVIFVIPVMIERKKTGIKAPVLYPNDRLIEELKLKPQQVEKYMCAQRAHQNNVEFLITYFPLLVISSFADMKQAAICGAVVWAGRTVTGLLYYMNPKKRAWGAW